MRVQPSAGSPEERSSCQSKSTPKKRDSNDGQSGNNVLLTSQRGSRPEFWEECFPCVQSKARSIQWGLWSPNDHRWMKIVQDNHEAYCRQRVTPPCDVEHFQIPRKIHHIWLGGNPLPQPFARLRESWGSWHPGWELRLWTDADIDRFGLENRLAFDSATNFGAKSDIFRYEILLREGGLYVDVDFVCFGSFDELHGTCDFYAGLSNTGTFEFNNGLIGCRAGHSLMHDIVRRVRDTRFPRPGIPLQITADRVHRGRDASSRGGGSETSRLLAAAAGGATRTGGDFDGYNKSGALESLGAFIGGPRGCEGLLSDLLTGDDRSQLQRAVEVERGSPMETIAKTGPGMFTVAVMEWIEALPPRSGAAGLSSTAAPETHHAAAGAASCFTDAGSTAPSAPLILPPSYFYPVPNDAKGDLVADGSEVRVREGPAGLFVREESLAAHLWAKSWIKTA